MRDTEDGDPANMNVRAGYLQGLSARGDGNLTDQDREMLRRASRSLIHASAKPWQNPSWGAIDERKAIAEWLRTPAAHLTTLHASGDTNASVVCGALADALDERTTIVEAEAAKRSPVDWEKRAEEAVETLGRPGNEGEYRIPHKELVALLRKTHDEGMAHSTYEVGYRDGENNILADLDRVLDEEDYDDKIVARVAAMVTNDRKIRGA